MTYEELLETIQNYIIRDDAPVESFIRRAETSLRTVARHYLSEKAVKLTVGVGGCVSLPSDFLEIRTITGTKTYRPIAVANAKLKDDEVGYYRVGNKLHFVGKPDAKVGFLYYASFPDLNATQSNWLFDRFPNVYLAAVLKESYRWEKDAEGVAIEQAALSEALAFIAEDDRRGRVSSTIIVESDTW